MAITHEEFAQAKAVVSQAIGILETVFCDLYLKHRLHECTPAESALMQDVDLFYSTGESILDGIDRAMNLPSAPADDIPPWEDGEQ